VADERELRKRISHEDEQAFDEFYRQTAPRLVAFIRQIVGSREAAEDVAQETYMRVWSRLNEFELEPAHLRAYLFGAGRRRAMDWWRKQSSAAAIAGDEAVENIATKCRVENASVIGDLFQRLPTEQRTMLWLREVEGQSYEELAQSFDVPVGTVRSRLFHAREALRKLWRGDGGLL